MTPRRAARADDSQAGIVEALRDLGCSVEIVGYPVDLIVGFGGLDFLADCKTDRVNVRKDGYARREKGRRTKVQEEFAKNHRGSRVRFWATPAEAVQDVLNESARAESYRASREAVEGQ